MASIRPFKAIFYNRAYVADHDSVITQPIGSITDQELKGQLEKSPYNIVRLEYGTSQPGNNESDSRYSRAAETFKQWMDSAVLQIVEQKSLYLYEQNFHHGSEHYSRCGVVAALKLEPYSTGTVMPHELTLFGPKKDHRKMLHHLQANIGPIFTLFPDVEKRIRALFESSKDLEPLVEFTDQSGLTHRIWPVRESRAQDSFIAYIASHSLLIADGHHRYTSALKYFQITGKKKHGAGFIMAALFDINDPGMLMLPTHRLVCGLNREQKETLQQKASREFKILDRGEAGSLNKDRYLGELGIICRKHRGMGWITREKAFLLIPERAVKSGALPVSILHSRLLKPALQASSGYQNEGLVTYSPDFNAVRDAVLTGKADYAFIVDAVPVDEIYRRARQGQVMPQKTTFFYPKLPNGLILCHMDLSH